MRHALGARSQPRARRGGAAAALLWRAERRRRRSPPSAACGRAARHAARRRRRRRPAAVRPLPRRGRSGVVRRVATSLAALRAAPPPRLARAGTRAALAAAAAAAATATAPAPATATRQRQKSKVGSKQRAQALTWRDADDRATAAAPSWSQHARCAPMPGALRVRASDSFGSSAPLQSHAQCRGSRGAAGTPAARATRAAHRAFGGAALTCASAVQWAAQ